ncbi:MAG: DsrE family protein [Hymenobacteraceae bacterium]|nr:DsrE family protein [Hymenobacteraceae bacterium]
MNLKLLFVFLLAILAAPTAFAQKQAETKASSGLTKTRRIVYDMTEGDTARHSGLMRQLNNVKRGWPDAQIEIVVHGRALNLLVTDKTTQATAIKALQDKGVVFAACENTMRRLQVEKNQLLPGVLTVPMAIGEIITKQDEGWGYIKF